ncbi:MULTISPECIES: glycosyl hydrolase family 8 [unclassified Novosphingobium]|uniref:glycosyl hydrolase family 8 n=1 Tax=unclassified Novosphingobium TaxID=2644732 RepID=UPI000D32767C|nr:MULTISPECIES: glycosyl hydrolase family 8 [unclassified Novosphingobium]
MAADRMKRPAGAGQNEGIDRRGFGFGLLVALTAACAPGRQSKAMASNGDWETFKARFLDPSGRIVDPQNGGISHSEGQSYGLVLALEAGDRATFELIADWTNDNLLRSDVALHAWRYDPSNPDHVPDRNNAADGDIMIAWALQRAGQRWGVGEWRTRSAAIRAAIRQRLVVDRFGMKLLLPGLEGFQANGRVIVNPSYFIWPAFTSFAEWDGPGVWQALADDATAIVSQARFGQYGLPADWVEVAGPGRFAPAPGHDPRFGFDAIRVPLFALAGHRASLVQPVANFWRQCLAQGQPIPAWIDLNTGERASFAVSNGGAAIASKLIGTRPPLGLAPEYFGAALQMLVGALT